MEQIEAEGNNKYIICSKCHMKFINDDEHIKTDFGYNRLNERYKNCVKCRKYNAEKVALRRAEVKEETARTGTFIPNIRAVQKPGYEDVVCDLCCKTCRRDYMRKHRMSLNCKAYVNYKLYFKFNLFDLDIDNICKLRHTMLHGDFDGAFYKFTDEERKHRIKLDKWIEIFIIEQLDIKHNMITKWGGLCEKLMNNMCQ